MTWDPTQTSRGNTTKREQEEFDSSLHQERESAYREWCDLVTMADADAAFERAVLDYELWLL